MILKVYNLITGVNETKHLAHLVSCDYKCGLNESVCNSKQKWNHDKCWCDCKELRACDSCIDDYIWNPTMWNREWNKACKTTEHLNIGNCSREERLLDKLVLICEDEILITTETSLDKKSNMWKKLLPYSHSFIGNYMHTIINFCLQWLLLALHKILEKEQKKLLPH